MLQQVHGKLLPSAQDGAAKCKSAVRAQHTAASQGMGFSYLPSMRSSLSWLLVNRKSLRKQCQCYLCSCMASKHTRSLPAAAQAVLCGRQEHTVPTQPGLEHQLLPLCCREPPPLLPNGERLKGPCHTDGDSTAGSSAAAATSRLSGVRHLHEPSVCPWLCPGYWPPCLQQQPPATPYHIQTPFTREKHIQLQEPKPGKL